MEKLNEEQKKLVENNHGLIYKFLKLKNLEFEDFYDLFAIALCKAAIFYNENADRAFSTYAIACMYNEYKNYLRHKYCDSEIPIKSVVSINNIFKDKHGYECEEDYYIEGAKEFDETLAELSEFFTFLSPVQTKVLKGLLYGYNEAELAKCFKCSHQNVSLVKRNICEKYKKYKGV